ncbi:hypothetical protein AZL_008600 [Azospirillum sp. B510]|uniref:Rieske 2Fe-2S domain-containing protein n=1 Tax=Azospirillum sp. (strain B510) TaxID=137722 RepID=UPI0001C4C371|nr:Rieske 2Fe-2S domain-containing protein [Azospirillum sp. B510]BAI71498.1 hypothetical protein AZL_008600 [Azospirillum sp. B510]
MARKKKIQKVDELMEPPVVGRFYLVPTIEYPLSGKVGHWPVLGPKHTDAEHFGFPWEHYHIDTRFWSGAMQRTFGAKKTEIRPGMATNYPLCTIDFGLTRRAVPHPPIEYRRLRCVAATITYQFAGLEPVLSLRRHMGEAAMVDTDHGPICPHRGFRLGSVPADGIITCPLHGLRFCAKSRKAVPPATTEVPHAA